VNERNPSWNINRSNPRYPELDYHRVASQHPCRCNGKIDINGIEGFWSIAKERLKKYHGVDPMKFPLYLKELEFVYNRKNRDLFNDLLEVLVSYSQVSRTE
jgi:hypothetical protein